VYEEIKYDEPHVILEKLGTLETEIMNGIDELKAIIK
jgi:hypothetical protein